VVVRRFFGKRCSCAAANARDSEPSSAVGRDLDHELSCGSDNKVIVEIVVLMEEAHAPSTGLHRSNFGGAYSQLIP
jgi:hypothetical protein